MIADEMSISRKQRIENMDNALLLFFEAIGPQSLRMFFINRRDARYEDVLPTTWIDLVEQGYISDSRMRPFDVLTTKGWTACLRLKGILGSPQFDKILGTLCASLKGHLDGRGQSVLVNVVTVANNTKIPEAMISNIIDARLIELLLNRRGVDWQPKMEGKLIIVPGNFGHERL